MSTTRLEAFSDGVLAILITIMVLALATPGKGHTDWAGLREQLPTFSTYVLSFVNIGIYWNNHHHLLQLAERINGGILWANLDLLFWLSLFPYFTKWMGETDFATFPTAVYGVVMLLAAIAYYILQTAIIAEHGRDSVLARAIGRDLKGKASPILYIAALALALVNRWISVALYVVVALMWLVPDRRLESQLALRDTKEEPPLQPTD